MFYGSQVYAVSLLVTSFENVRDTVVFSLHPWTCFDVTCLGRCDLRREGRHDLVMGVN